jgi:radical SAM protein with 4Fe4S-binding SPASM domain
MKDLIIYEQDLGNTDKGKEILLELNKKINTGKPLPRCIFSLKDWIIYEKMHPKLSCEDCNFLYIVTPRGWIRSCYGFLGPKREFMKDNAMIYDYFNAFHKTLELPDICKACVFLKRGFCDGLCFKKRKKE